MHLPNGANMHITRPQHCTRKQRTNGCPAETWLCTPCEPDALSVRRAEDAPPPQRAGSGDFTSTLGPGASAGPDRGRPTPAAAASRPTSTRATTNTRPPGLKPARTQWNVDRQGGGAQQTITPPCDWHRTVPTRHRRSRVKTLTRRRPWRGITDPAPEGLSPSGSARPRSSPALHGPHAHLLRAHALPQP